jgi:glycine oxidase
VRAGDRQYVADAAVVALGSWSRRLRVRHVAALPVRPVRGQLIALDWSIGRRPQRIVWGPHCYTVPWSDGTLLVGATVEDAGFDEHPTTAGVQALASAVVDLLPESSRARFEGVRVGLRPALPDGLPAIGPLLRAPRVVIATGHYRNGVLFAPLTATMVARWLLDNVRDELFAATSPDRFAGVSEMMGGEGSP